MNQEIKLKMLYKIPLFNKNRGKTYNIGVYYNINSKSYRFWPHNVNFGNML